MWVLLLIPLFGAALALPAVENTTPQSNVKPQTGNSFTEYLNKLNPFTWTAKDNTSDRINAIYELLKCVIEQNSPNDCRPVLDRFRPLLDDKSWTGNYTLAYGLGFRPQTPVAPTNTPATGVPVTAAPVTAAPVTAAPVTAAPVTAAPVTAAPAS